MSPALRAAVAFAGLLLAIPRVAHAQRPGDRTPSFLSTGLQGPPKKKKPVKLDPDLPLGALVDLLRPRPGDFERACSERRPVCVHLGPEVEPAVGLEALAELEAAYERLVLGLALPAPLLDRAGGGPELDLYLGQALGDLTVVPESRDLGPTDRAAGYCTLGDPGRADLPRAASLCLGEAVALGLNSGEGTFSRRAIATQLWWATGHPGDADVAAIDAIQARPEQPLLGRDRAAHAEGAALFYDFLDWTEGAGDPGVLPLTVYSLAAGRSRAGSHQYNNEPDVYDVVRHTLDESPRKLARLFGRFAVARAFLGSRDDGTHFPQLAWVGDFGRVRFEWSIGYSSLPRHLALGRPVFPLGAAYVFIDFDKLPKFPELGFEAWWEPPVAFQWTLVRLDGEGRELGRLPVNFQENATHVEKSVMKLEDTKAILLVGTQLGGTGSLHPFDPDFEPFEPHGCHLHVADL